MTVRRHLMLGFAVAVLFGVFASPAAPSDNGTAIDDYNFAAWLYNTGKYGLAVDAYEAFLKRYAEHDKATDARFGLAQSLFHLDRFEEAAAQYAMVRERGADFGQGAELLFQLGQCRAALNATADAERCFADLCERFPDHYLADWAVARRGACLVGLGRHAEAEALLQPLVERYAPAGQKPADVPAVKTMLANLDAAGLSAGDAFLTLVERSVFYLALARYEQERYADAHAAFKAFLDRYPNSELADEARFRSAQSLYREGQFAEAAKAYGPVAEGDGPFASAAAFERALALHKSGNLKDAAAAFREAARRFPDGDGAGKAALYAGTSLYEAGDYNGAVERLRPLAENADAPSDEAAYWIGMSHLKAGRSADAESAFGAALARHPKSEFAGDMQLGLADARLAQERYAEAADAFQTYARLFPKTDQAPRALYAAAVALHRTDRYAESDAVCDELLRAFAGHALAMQALFLSGENRFLLQRYDPAADRYTALLKRTDAPADRVASAHYRLAWIHRYAQQFDRALKELDAMDRGAAGPSIAAEADYLRGICLQATGATGDAAKALREYLASGDPSRFGDDALLKLAACETKAEHPKEAEEALRRLIKDFAGSELLSQARYQLAESHFGERDFAKAAQEYRRLAEAQPPDALTAFGWFGVGTCAFEQERWQDAAETFAKLVEQFPDSELVAQARYRQGQSLMKLSQWQPAERAFRAMLDAAPDDALARPARIAMGSCLQELKQWDAAAEAFRQAAAQPATGEENPASLLYEQAWSLREAGKPDASLAVFKTLADRFPDDPLAADAYFYLAEARYEGQAAGGNSKPDARALREARALYEKARAASRDGRLTDKALYRMGWCDWLMEDAAGSAAQFDALIKECPKSELVPDALFQAGVALAKAGEPAAACARFEQLIALPGADDFQYLAEAYTALAENLLLRDQTEQALDTLNAYFNRFPDGTAADRANFLRGKAQYALKRYDDALDSFATVTRLTKSDVAAQAQFYIGQIHQSREAYRDALLAYLRIPALYPGNREWIAAATFEGAKCSEALGADADARAAYQSLIDDYADTRWAGMATDRLKN